MSKRQRNRHKFLRHWRSKGYDLKGAIKCGAYEIYLDELAVSPAKEGSEKTSISIMTSAGPNSPIYHVWQNTTNQAERLEQLKKTISEGFKVPDHLLKQPRSDMAVQMGMEVARAQANQLDALAWLEDENE